MKDASDNDDSVLNTGGNSWFNGGNFGINDNNPSYKLSVNNGTTDSMVARFYNHEVGINFGSYGTGSSYQEKQ